MKEIKLTQGKVALVDDEDFERINKYKWYARKDYRSGRFYAGRTEMFPFSHPVYMHREVMNAKSGIEVDHIYGEDTLDNRRSNLRLCTESQNRCNRGMQKNNTSGFKGVSWIQPRRKWMASIRIHSKNIYIGLFATAEEAARAYDKKARELHGDFARTNFNDY